MSRFGRFVSVFLIAVVMSAIATFVSICIYGLLLPDASHVLRFAAWLAPGLFVHTLPIALANGVIMASLWPTRYRAALVLIAAATGLVAGRAGSLHSPHVSPALASLSSGFAWAIVAAVFLLIFDTRLNSNRAGN